MLGGEVGGLINARLELSPQCAPAGDVIAEHEQEPEVQCGPHPVA